MSWKVLDVLPRYRAWVEHSAPSIELQRRVLEAVKAIAHDPYAASYNGYFYAAALPGCFAENGDVVTCTWTVHPQAETIRFGSLVEATPPVEFDLFDGEEIEPS